MSLDKFIEKQLSEYYSKCFTETLKRFERPELEKMPPSEQTPDWAQPSTWTDEPRCDGCKKKFGYGESWFIDTKTGVMYHEDCEGKLEPR